MDFFGGHERESILQIEPHLVPKHRNGAGAGSIGFLGAVPEYVPEQIVVCLHVSFFGAKIGQAGLYLKIGVHRFLTGCPQLISQRLTNPSRQFPENRHFCLSQNNRVKKTYLEGWRVES